MAISSEIEKLEKRWQATSGLVFAPLAEAYRKAGLQARALEILEQGLALHTEYGPALIVRARCHLDTGDYPAAEEAFNQALGRDPTDPIALRGLADVFERTGRLGEAIAHLRTLVDVDPRNSEARVMLDRMLATPTEIPEVIAAAPVPEAVPEYLEPVRDQLDSLDFDVVNLSAVESLPAIPEERTASPMDEEFVVQSFAVEPLEVPDEVPVEAPVDVPVAEEISGPILWTPAPAPPIAQPEPYSEPVLEVLVEAAAPAIMEIPVEEPAVETPVLEAPAFEELMVEVPAVEVAYTAEPLPVEEQVVEEQVVEEQVVEEVVAEFVPVEVMGEIAPAEPVFDLVEEMPPTVAEEIEAVVEEPTVEEYALRVDAPLDVAPVETVAEPQPESAPEFHAEPVEAPALIVTESMAELFLKQGHRELALAVYRQLAERSPDSDSLRSAIVRLEQELAPAPAPEPPAPARHPFAAAETGGRSVERRLQAVLHAPPPTSASTVLPPAIEPGAEPTRPSADALSLAEVFGDEPGAKPRSEEAVTEASASEPSYDEFFGAGPTEPAAAPTPRGEGEDLRQFNEWLKGLKR